jgi:imidazole glycerol-phosphate synthase subunit HisF
MFRPRVIPCLLLKDNGLVKTTAFESPRYIGDPINAVRIFNEKQADELLFLNIMASRKRGAFGKMVQNPIPLAMIANISRECLMPLTYGGGVQSFEDIRGLFNAGVEKVAINTSAIANPDFVKEASDVFGSQSIIVSIDAKRRSDGRYEVFSHGGGQATGSDPSKLAKRMEELGAGEIMITSIDNDGSMAGYDITLTRRIADLVDIPVIACGGAGSLGDLKKGYYEGNASALAAGSLFVYHGRKRAVLISYPTRRELEETFAEVPGSA